VAVNSKLRDDLLKAMGGVTPRRLNQIASARSQELLISHEQAVYTIAHERGINLGKYLSADEREELRPIIAQMKQAAPVQMNDAPAPKQKTKTRKPILVTIGNFDVQQVPGIRQRTRRRRR
jgi:hypothetical protein